MNDDQDFIQAILADPGNDTLRLVYADWLEERGDKRAEYIRVEAALAVAGQVDSQRELQRRVDELRKAIDPRWQALLDRTLLDNCVPQFRARCPKKWEK